MIQYVFTQYLKAINTKKNTNNHDDTFAPKYISIKCPKNIIYMLTEIKTNWGDLNNGNFKTIFWKSLQKCKGCGSYKKERIKLEITLSSKYTKHFIDYWLKQSNHLQKNKVKEPKYINQNFKLIK